ncbi:E3 ubiquitin-protein ligase DTX3L1 isoform X2 [Cynoglossus semilaevis]|nr:E3 ubiquitin-protein ligase DTX3L-like isoform X2 [Cynoglossus semilaevis]
MSRHDYIPSGDQPEGQMTLEVIHRDLPGFPNDHTIKINFIFPDGIQAERHPHPGQPFSGMHLSAYLPDNQMGRKILKLIDKAFNQKLLFHVGTSYDGRDMVTPSIPLNIQPNEERKGNGKPDLDYLQYVEKLLREKGIE